MNKGSFIGISAVLIAAGIFFFIQHPKLGGIMIIVGVVGLLLSVDFKELRKIPLKLRSDIISLQKFKNPGEVVKVIEKTEKRYKLFGEQEEHYLLRVRLGQGSKKWIPVEEEMAEKLKPKDRVDVIVKVYYDKNNTVLHKEFVGVKKLPEKKPAKEPAS